jgi:hypothetical protein
MSTTGFTARRSRGLAMVLSLVAAFAVLAPLRWALASPPKTSAEAPPSKAAAAAASEKLRKLQETPSDLDVSVSEDEANSYFYYELAPLYPVGVSNVKVRFTPGVVHGSCEVDFDRLKSSRDPGLLGYLFLGAHTLTVDGGFSGADGVGRFDLGTVTLDGVPLPATLVQLLIDNYLTPRYPGFALDKPFPLPDSIDRVRVGTGAVEAAARPRSH